MHNSLYKVHVIYVFDTPKPVFSSRFSETGGTYVCTEKVTSSTIFKSLLHFCIYSNYNVQSNTPSYPVNWAHLVNHIKISSEKRRT